MIHYQHFSLDEQLMIQLFQNLIGNAIKYRSEKTPKIYISAKKEDKKWLFSVKDNGIGISHDHLERIFTIFQTVTLQRGIRRHWNRTSNCTKNSSSTRWTNLGQNPELGKGSTFYFTVPL